MSPGERIGSWVVQSSLGEGGMGRVLRCHHLLDPSQLAAVKLLQPDTEMDHRQRLIQEFKLLRQLSHPHVVKFLEAGLHEDQVYLVTELLKGETLEIRLQRSTLTEPEAVTLFRALAQGVAAAHEQGIWHRDLKPANIFLSTDGPKILDFGIAVREGGTRLTQAGFFIGTPIYMAPEAFQGEIGGPGDVYALGLLLWEALTGRKAFSLEKGERALVKAKVQSDPFDPGGGFSPALRRAVAAATDVDPDGRPTAETWLAEVEVLHKALWVAKVPKADELSTLLLLPCPRCGAQLKPGAVCAVCETSVVPVRGASPEETVPQRAASPGRTLVPRMVVASLLVALLGGLLFGGVGLVALSAMWLLNRP